MEAEKKEGLARLGILEVLSYDEDPDRAPDGDEAELSKEIALKQLPITRALLMGALYAALYLPTLNQTVVSNALPKILSDINKFGSDIGYTWVGSVYSLAQAMALPLFGQLGHTPGRKWALLVAMGIFMLGSTLCGTAVNIQMLLAARTVQGLGAGGISGLIFVLMADMVRVKGVGKYTELYAAVCAVITAVGPLVGGALAETANWRWVLVSLLSGVAALVAFVPSEMSAESPVIPFRFFKHRTRIGAYMAVFFHSVAFSGLNYWLPMYFQAVRQQTSSDSGLSMLPWTLSFAVMSAAAGIFVVAMRRYQEFIWSGFFVASVAFACLTLLTSDTSTAITSLLLVIAGLGVGPNFNTPLFPVHASFDMSDSDYAATLSQSTSAYAFLRSLGSSIGITASGLVFFEDVAQHQSASLTVFNLTQAIEYSELLPEVEENANVEILHTAMQHVFIQVCVCINEPEEDQDDDGEGARTIPRVDSFGTEDG
ncbi:hypothetical protein TruAng_009919 [Truncatella angustata]|nr:hypothetical protein TruAng_009919 [Truncatella angustata]